MAAFGSQLAAPGLSIVAPTPEQPVHAAACAAGVVIGGALIDLIAPSADACNAPRWPKAEPHRLASGLAIRLTKPYASPTVGLSNASTTVFSRP